MLMVKWNLIYEWTFQTIKQLLNPYDSFWLLRSGYSLDFQIWTNFSLIVLQYLMQVIWFVKQLEILLLVTLEIKKIIIKSFDSRKIFSYVNPNSEFKYRVVTMFNLIEGVVVDYINDNLEYKWKRHSINSRLTNHSYFSLVEH